MTLPVGAYRDPLDFILMKESNSCKGCIFAQTIFDRQMCAKGRPFGRKCKHYQEKEGKPCIEISTKQKPR